MKVKICNKTLDIRKVSNREVKEIIATISAGAVTTEEVTEVAQNPAGIADNLEKFADAISIAVQKQVTGEELWEADPEETLTLIEKLFELNNVAGIMKSVGKLKAQLKK